MDEIKSTVAIILVIFALGFGFVALNDMFPWMFEFHELKSDGKIGYIFRP